MIIAAIILLVFAIVGLSHCGSSSEVFCIIVNVLTIIACILGIVGAIRLRADWLSAFFVLLVVLIVIEIIFIIVAAVDGYSVSSFLWQLVVLALLVITACFTADLRHAVGYTSIL